MKTNFLFLLTVLCAFCVAGCSDKDEPLGNAAMFHGTWGISHMKVTAQGQTVDQDVDASVSTITFNADGTATEYQNGIYAAATWNYDAGKRLLHMTDSNYGTQLDWQIRTLSDTEFVGAFSMTEEGLAMDVVATYKRVSPRSVATAPQRVEASAAAPLAGELIRSVKF